MVADWYHGHIKWQRFLFADLERLVLESKHILKTVKWHTKGAKHILKTVY